MRELFRHPLFICALVLSSLLHIGALIGLPPLAFHDEFEAKLPPPLEARLLPPPPKKAAAIKAPRATQTKHRAESAASFPVPTSVPQPDLALSETATGSPRPDTAAAAMPASRAAATYPYRTVSLRYNLYYGESETWVGEVKHQWTFEQGRYALNQRIEAVGFAALFFGGRYLQSSTGSLGPEGLMPDAYTLDQNGKEERVDFNWETSYLTMAQKGKAQDAPLRVGTQDLLSMLHQLYFMQPIEQRLVMYVATPRRLETHIVEVMGEEDLQLPVGPIRTLHLRSKSSEGGVLNIWLDRDRALLPVRIHHLNRKGVLLDYKLQSMTVDQIGLASPL